MVILRNATGAPPTKGELQLTTEHRFYGRNG